MKKRTTLSMLTTSIMFLLLFISSQNSSRDLASAIGSTPTAEDNLFLPLITVDNVRQVERLMDFNVNQNVSAVWSPTGTLLAIYGDQGVQILDVANRNAPAPFFATESLTTTITFSPDGKFLVQATSDGNLHIWDTSSETEVKVLKGHDYEISEVAFGSNGDLLASADIEGNTILWNFDTYEILAQFEHVPLNPIRDLAFTSDGSVLAIAAILGGIQLKNSSTYERFDSALDDDGITAVEFSPNGEILAYGGLNGVIRLWGDELWNKPLALFRSHSGSITDLTFSMDGSLLVSADEDGTVRFWDVEAASELMILTAHNGPINNLSLGLDGSIITSAGQDGQVILWAVRQP